MALQIMMVALGCALGGVARFLLGKGVNAQPWAEEFPWATLIINIVGSMLLGVVAELYVERETSLFRQELYIFLGTGFCGGFTTFSTFSLELLNLFKAGAIFSGFAYILMSTLLSLLGVYLGMFGVKNLFPHH